MKKEKAKEEEEEVRRLLNKAKKAIARLSSHS